MSGYEIACIGLVAAVSLAVRQAAAGEPLRLQAGPHLFLDDFLIAAQSNLKRVVTPPKKLEDPVVTGRKDGCFQPYLTVLRDPKTGRFRIWYGVPENAGQSHLGYMESEGGIRWIRPHRVLPDPARIQFGVSILDEGPDFSDPAKRYKYGWWNDGGLQVAASPDGLAWKPLAPGVVLPHNHDINCIFRDTIRNRYLAIVSTYTTGDAWKGQRRVSMQSESSDLIRWEKPRYIITPDDCADEGETQFYCMGGLIARGGLLIGMVRVLRDDLPADPGGPVAGIGYTVLAWSRDGSAWQRDREPFMDRNPRAGAWDHAMTWTDCQIIVGDETYLYYGGYARGHKIERFTERQIGLARMPLDRYAAREAGDVPGSLKTPVLALEASRLSLNADARGGEIRLQITDAVGKPLPGFAFKDCEPVTGDSVRAAARWKRPLSGLRGKPVHLEFALRRARLYGFALE
ncbi:MAG: hypothetical protein IT210_25695 [Armatimonadetes bacterium]|nr:hypothetical protein [Armatimonadota bacterium]